MVDMPSNQTKLNVTKLNAFAVTLQNILHTIEYEVCQYHTLNSTKFHH